MDIHTADGLLLEIAAFTKAHPGVEFPWEEEPWPETGDIEELWEMLAWVERLGAAAKVLRSRVEGLMTEEIRRNGAIVFAGTRYYPTRQTRKGWTSEDADRMLLSFIASKVPSGEISEILDRVAEVIRLDAANVRTTALSALAALDASRNGADDTAARETGKAAVASFIENLVTGDGYALGKMPTSNDRTPKWAVGAPHGTRTPRPPKREG